MALILEFASILWCLVNAIKLFVIISVFHAIVIGAMLTLETDINVF
jgi:hypothetical protein